MQVKKSYEAAVKLNSGHVVIYHNINTGLYKFHQFIQTKFIGEQKWLYYKIRRKKTEEVIGLYRNSFEEKKIEYIKIYTDITPNSKNSGYFVSLIFKRNNFEIKRNVFASGKFVLDAQTNFIVLPKWLYSKMIEQGIEDLYQYYLNQHHQVEKNEFIVGFDKIETIIKLIPGKEGNAPEINFP